MTARLVLGPDIVKEGELKSFRSGQRWVLVTRINGQLKAMDDLCNHAGCQLSNGWLDQRQRVVCPCHEIGFNLDTGKNETSPGIADDQPVYTVEVVDGQVVVTMPEGGAHGA